MQKQGSKPEPSAGASLLIMLHHNAKRILNKINGALLAFSNNKQSKKWIKVSFPSATRK